MFVGIPREIKAGETRVAASPESIKKLLKKGLHVRVEKSAGVAAGFADKDYQMDGVEIVDSKAAAFSCEIILKIHKPTSEEISLLKPNVVLISLIEPFNQDGTIEKLASANVSAIGMELIPRTTRAQSMDVLSSQANIAGYRAVLEASTHYGRFFGMMMTSAGMAKPAKVIVIGAGVAGLQAIATAKRLGAQVEAFDVRAEVKEQILSLGAKFIEINVGEEGSGAGGYAKELSEEGKKKQILGLSEKIKKCDIVISTANIPGRKAPVLITEEAVKGMRTGSVIVDMAAANGGNCTLSEADKIVTKNGVTLIGITNFPALMPADASNFFGNNLVNLLSLIVETKDGKPEIKWNLEDDIVAASLVTHQGKVRWSKK
ncbi:MAG: transhydrogenase alpha subunit [Bacteriovoracaceae bacterium]|nr:transhydrogenase alpha subunit [Bacteriovoracaceae bacterium]